MHAENYETHDRSIVNPARLPPALADNICISCHQTGDVRVLKPGKQMSDFRPGTALDDTLTILMVPPRREAPPQQDLLEHYYSMPRWWTRRRFWFRMGFLRKHQRRGGG